MRKTYEVTGYTHSDGYALCCKHADYGNMDDDNNIGGKVQAIFLGDEWDYTPTCDVCNEEIDVTVIGEDEKEHTCCSRCGCYLDSTMTYRTMPDILCGDCVEDLATLGQL